METKWDYPTPPWILKTSILTQAHRNSLSQLLIVPGHALMQDETEPGKDFDYYKNKDQWHLADYQKAEFDQYVEHIVAGVQALEQNPNALLVFSGGRTRPGQEKWSEAGSYLTFARSMPIWNSALESRVLTEDFARDSLQNLCFSYFRYLIALGRFPETIKIFGSSFKAERFDWHRESLGISPDGFEYVGVNNPPEEKMDFIHQGEQERLEGYKKDPYGLSEDLIQRNAQRDPHGDGNPYASLIEKLPETIDKDQLRRSFGGAI